MAELKSGVYIAKPDSECSQKELEKKIASERRIESKGCREDKKI